MSECDWSHLDEVVQIVLIRGASVDLGNDIRDPGLVNDGTKCGTGKVPQ